MPAQQMPKAEVQLDEDVVRALLRAQHPDLADLPLAEVAGGWDNAIFRLGEELAVRLPRRALAADLVEHEHRWLPELAPRLPLPTPVPLRTGRPAAPYPWSWTVCRWFPGSSALATPPRDVAAAAQALGRFVAALHTPAPVDAPANPYRGIPLADRDTLLHEALRSVGDRVDEGRVLACWAELVAAPVWPGPAVWLHGDLHPGNLVVQGGALAAVIDFGDLTAGDPATDLAVAWMLLPPPLRPRFRAAAGDVDDATWDRARGWALAWGLAVLASSADNPAFDALGQRTVEAALAD